VSLISQSKICRFSVERMRAVVIAIRFGSEYMERRVIG